MSLESYAYKRLIKEEMEFEEIDGRNIVRELYNYMQSQPNGNIGIQVPGAFPESMPREIITYSEYDFNYIGKAIEDLVALDDGFDYRIHVEYNSSNLPVFYLRLGYPRLGLSYPSPSVATFEYPGAIQNYWWPESAGSSANSLVITGGGSGAGLSYIEGQDAASLYAKWPLLEKVIAHPDDDEEVLPSRLAPDLEANRVPITRPTFEISPNKEPYFGDWTIGDDVLFKVQDARFPLGMQFLDRVIGWELRPPSEEGVEYLKMEMDGSDAISEGAVEV